MHEDWFDEHILFSTRQDAIARESEVTWVLSGLSSNSNNYRISELKLICDRFCRRTYCHIEYQKRDGYFCCCGLEFANLDAIKPAWTCVHTPYLQRDRSLPVQPISTRQKHNKKKEPTNLCAPPEFLKQMCLPCLIVIKSCYFHYRINKPFACSRCYLRSVLGSRDLDVLRAQRIIGFFILITHKSTRSENAIACMVYISSYQQLSLVCLAAAR